MPAAVSAGWGQRGAHQFLQCLSVGPQRDEIGYVTGFADTAHFTRTFKAAVGATPTDWRRAHAGAP